METVNRSLLAMIVLLLAAGYAAAETRVALVIGNSNYKLISPLKNPENDARLMRDTLKQLGFDVVFETDADRRKMVKAMRSFGQKLSAGGHDAVGLFFYAGHGVQALNSNFLLPLNATIADETDLELEAVNARWVLRQMERAGNKLNIIVLDACRNNPFQGAFRSATRGLTRINAPSGSLIAYSAAPGQVAQDGTGKNSPYTAALARAMKEPGRELIKVFRLARVEVEKLTGGSQTPWEEQSLTRDFYFVPKAEKPAFTAQETGQENTDTLFWSSIKDSENVAAYEEYLRRFPKGVFSGLAKLRIEALKEQVASLPPAEEPTGEVRIGSVAALTGPISSLVEAIVAARRLAFRHVNEQGGLLNGGKAVEVLVDSACSPQAGLKAGKKLLEESVVAAVGPNCSAATLAMVKQATIDAGLVTVSDTATSPAIRELPDSDLVFRVVPADDRQAAILAKVAFERGTRAVAMTYANDDYNRYLAEQFRQSFTRLGGRITRETLHEPDKASYRSELADIAGGTRTLVIFGYFGSSGKTIIRNSLENGLFDYFLVGDGMMVDQSTLANLGGHALRGKLLGIQVTTDQSGPSFRSFATAFRAAGEDPGSAYVAQGYDAAFLVALAIEQARSTRRNLISAALRKVASAPGLVIRPGEWRKAKEAIAAGKDINYEGAAGSLDFDTAGDAPGMFKLLSIDNSGQWVSRLID